jgi:hypothetical protein
MFNEGDVRMSNRGVLVVERDFEVCALYVVSEEQKKWWIFRRPEEAFTYGKFSKAWNPR